MTNNQKSEIDGLVQTFYSLIYEEFNNINEDLNEDNFIFNFDKYFKNFVENGCFAVEEMKTVDGKKTIVKSPYLEFHTEKEENFVFINKKIKKVRVRSFNKIPFKDDVDKKKNEKTLLEKLADGMGYVFKKYPSKNEKNNKTTYKDGFRIPYSDFERQIKIYAFEQLSHRVKKLEKGEENLKKENEDLKKDIGLKKRRIAEINDKIFRDEKYINVLECEIKDSKAQYEKLKEKNSKLNASIKKTLPVIEDLKKNNNALVFRYKKESSEFEKFKKNYAIVIYNIWRMGRNIEKDNKFNKQNSDSMNILIEFVGKNLEYNDGFEDKEVDLEFLENQKLLINESLKSLERTFKQYNRVRILLEKSGIKIEEYDDIKNMDKLNVTILDVIESSEIQEIMVETVKPSIYYAEKRIFEGEVIITKPKN